MNRINETPHPTTIVGVAPSYWFDPSSINDRIITLGKFDEVKNKSITYPSLFPHPGSSGFNENAAGINGVATAKTVKSANELMSSLFTAPQGERTIIQLFRFVQKGTAGDFTALLSMTNIAVVLNNPDNRIRFLMGNPAENLISDVGGINLNQPYLLIERYSVLKNLHNMSINGIGQLQTTTATTPVNSNFLFLSTSDTTKIGETDYGITFSYPQYVENDQIDLIRQYVSNRYSLGI